MTNPSLENIAIGAKCVVALTGMYQAVTVQDPLVTFFGMTAAATVSGVSKYGYIYGVFCGLYSIPVSAMKKNWLGMPMGMMLACSSAYLYVYESTKRQDH